MSIVQPIVLLASEWTADASLSLHAAARCARSAAPSGFTRGLFLGKLNTDFFYPYPEPAADDLETLSMVVGPFESFMENENDPAKNDEVGDVAPEVAEALKPMGAYGLMVPEKYGGVGLTSTGYARLVEVVGSQDLGLGIFLGAHQSIGYKGIALYGSEEQKQKYLPALAAGDRLAAFCLTEPSSGSDAQSIRSRAVPAEDGSGDFILNGGKSECSRAVHACSPSALA